MTLDDNLFDMTDVLQLSPHQKTTQSSQVEKSDSEDLLSLDELYEQSGQEKVDIILEGLGYIKNKKKLARIHGLVMDIKGAENWMVLPDELNYYKGAEKFIASVGKGIKNIIKAICKFVTGVYTSITSKAKEIIEMEDLYTYTLNKATNIEESAEDLLEGLNSANVGNFSLVDILYSNPNPNSAIFKDYRIITSNPKLQVAGLIERYMTGYNYFYKELLSNGKIMSFCNDLRDMKQKYEDMMRYLRGVEEDSDEDESVFDYTVCRKVSDELKDILYKSTTLQDATEILRNFYEIVKPEVFAGIKREGSTPSTLRTRKNIVSKGIKLDINYYKGWVTGNEETVLSHHRLKTVFVDNPLGKYQFPFYEINFLKSLVNLDDADIFTQLDQLSPDMYLLATFSEFFNTISQSAQALELLLEEFNELTLNIITILRWCYTIEEITVYSTVKEINDSIASERGVGCLDLEAVNPETLKLLNKFINGSIKGKYLKKCYEKNKGAIWSR